MRETTAPWVYVWEGMPEEGQNVRFAHAQDGQPLALEGHYGCADRWLSGISGRIYYTIQGGPTGVYAWHPILDPPGPPPFRSSGGVAP